MRVHTIRPHCVFSMTSSVLPYGRAWPVSLGHEHEDQRHDERVEGHGLGHADADEHVGADVAGDFGLAGDALERLADEDAEADTGAYGAEAHGEAGAEFRVCVGVHAVSSWVVTLVMKGSVSRVQRLSLIHI